MNKTKQELIQENEQLTVKRNELWRSIKDFDKTSWENAERVGKVLKDIQTKIHRNNKVISLYKD